VRSRWITERMRVWISPVWSSMQRLWGPFWMDCSAISLQYGQIDWGQMNLGKAGDILGKS